MKIYDIIEGPTDVTAHLFTPMDSPTLQLKVKARYNGVYDIFMIHMEAEQAYTMANHFKTEIKPMEINYTPETTRGAS